MDSIPDEALTIIDALTELEAERIRRGISQKQFAETIGMKQPQLAKIERLDSVPSLMTLSRYAKGLGKEIRLSIVTR
ncbi:helix-turn-helix transcriptional regulator [Lacticaseibacillus casei]|nr:MULTISPECIES: helix-turn-helix transcriptional regulator [Lacticaseibacillus]MDE3283292.1 helix-turn-helix transcriptional regulator [Lacticaseibacillus casei]